MKKISAVFLLACLSAFLLSGCGMKNAASSDVEPAYPTEPDKKDWEAEMKYWEENAVDEEFLSEQNKFAFKTAGALLSFGEENVIYSPISLYYALALAASGMAGETAEELYGFLECAKQETAAENAGKLYRTLYRDSKIGKTKIATSLWADKRLNLKAEFRDRAAKEFYASFHLVDFTDSGTAEEMGKWVAEHTNGTIAPEIKTSPEQVMSILNTVYFYDQWQDRFQKGKTKKDMFTLSDGSKKEADFMNAEYDSHGFTKGEHFTRSSIGLKENGSMVFVLPDEGVSVEELCTSPEALQNAFESGASQMGEVVFKVPKFTTDSKLDVKKMMEKLGVSRIFSGGDFSAMTEAGGTELFISQILQSGHISLNEDGVEASAFTEIQYCGAALPTGRAEMILDRPFLYGIKNRGVWLFIGVCGSPS